MRSFKTKAKGCRPFASRYGYSDFPRDCLRMGWRSAFWRFLWVHRPCINDGSDANQKAGDSSSSQSINYGQMIKDELNKAGGALWSNVVKDVQRHHSCELFQETTKVFWNALTPMPLQTSARIRKMNQKTWHLQFTRFGIHLRSHCVYLVPLICR